MFSYVTVRHYGEGSFSERHINKDYIVWIEKDHNGSVLLLKDEILHVKEEPIKVLFG